MLINALNFYSNAYNIDVVLLVIMSYLFVKLFSLHPYPNISITKASGRKSIKKYRRENLFLIFYFLIMKN